MQPKRVEMCAALWAEGIKAEFGYKAAPTIKDALGYADDNGIPFVVLFGESELASASVKVLPASSCHSSYVDPSTIEVHVVHLMYALLKCTVTQIARALWRAQTASSCGTRQLLLHFLFVVVPDDAALS